MKKFAAIVLAMVLILSLAFTAVAEQRAYIMATVTDAEGNILNVEEMPILVFGIDDESMECAFGSEEEMFTGTVKIAGQTEEAVVLNCTLEDGSAITVTWAIAEDVMTFVDENGNIYMMFNTDLLGEAAA